MENIVIYKELERENVAGAKDLLREYIRWIQFDLCFQDIENELKNFPAMYRAPEGAFIIALEGAANTVAGGVGLKKLDDATCEMKRLYVRERYQGRGIGKRLVTLIIGEAARRGYKRMRLDTLAMMEHARALYARFGFYPIAPYVYNPLPGALYLEKILFQGPAAT